MRLVCGLQDGYSCLRLGEVYHVGIWPASASTSTAAAVFGVACLRGYTDACMRAYAGVYGYSEDAREYSRRACEGDLGDPSVCGTYATLRCNESCTPHLATVARCAVTLGPIPLDQLQQQASVHLQVGAIECKIGRKEVANKTFEQACALRLAARHHRSLLFQEPPRVTLQSVDVLAPEHPCGQ